MVNFNINNIENKNIDHIIESIKNDSIIITNTNNLTCYKREIIKANLKQEIFVYDLKSFVYNIYRRYINKYPILTKDQQRMYFLKAINNIQLNYLNKYPFEIVDDLIKIYNDEHKLNLKRSNYEPIILKEIDKVIQQYNKLIEHQYIDEVKVYNEVISFLTENKTYENTDFFIADIYYFSNLEIKLLKALFKNSKQANCYFLSNELIEGLDIHWNSFRSLYKQDDNIKLLNNKNPKANLTQNLYKLEHPTDLTTLEFVSVFASRNLYDEVIFVANQILKNIREKNMRYSDFAIVSNCIDEYQNYFDLIFKKAQIPYHKLNKTNNNFFNYIITLLKVMENSEDIKTIKDLLSYKLYPYNDFQLNNLYKQLNDTDGTLDEDIVQLINSLSPCGTVSENLKTIYSHLEHYKIIEKINKTSPDAWNQFINYLNLLHDINGNDFCDITYLKQMFGYLFDRTIISDIYIDEVMINSPGNISDDHKIVFFIGMNEGIVPQKPSGNLLINNYELYKIYENYPKFNDIFIDKLNTFVSITKPEHVYLTYYKINKTGSRANPSSLIKKMFKMYPNIKQYSKGDFKDFHNVPSIIYSHYQTNDSKVLVNNLFSYFNQFDYYKPYNKRVNLIPRFYKPTNLKLFNNEDNKLYLSNTSINTFNHCQFKYFCDYTLRLRKSDEYKYDARIVGTYIHYLLEQLITNKVPKDNINGMLLFLKGEFIKENNIKLSNSENYFFTKLNENMLTLWPIIYNEMEASSFSNDCLELKLNELGKQTPITTINDIQVYLTGIIDRLDIYEYYFRVIDYKTGATDFKLADVANGINLQLLIYLVGVQKLRKLKPAGFFYMPSYINFKSDTNNLKQYRLTGMFLNDPKVINALGGDFIDDYIKAYSYGKLSPKVMFNDDQLNTLINYTNSAIIKTANNIIEGEISINPFKDKNLCDYCDYKSICGIEKNSKQYRYFKKYKDTDIWDVLGGVSSEMD